MEPQLALPVLPDKLYKYPNYVMEPKLDGIRCIAYKGAHEVTLTSRGGKDLTEKLPYLVTCLQETMWKHEFLDGELGYWAGNYTIDFNQTTRVLGSGVDVALQKQEEYDRNIQFFVFDNCNIFPDWERREGLEYWYDESYRLNYTAEGPVVLVPRMDAFDQAWYDEYVLNGGEGVMLKNPDACYYEGKRKANTWYKLKRFDSFEVQITGFTEGFGKYEDMIGAIEFEYKREDGLLHIVTCSGMDDLTRLQMTDQMKHYIGKWIEVKHFGFTAGTPRFPQFLRMRPDLDS